MGNSPWMSQDTCAVVGCSLERFTFGPYIRTCRTVNEEGMLCINPCHKSWETELEAPAALCIVMTFKTGPSLHDCHVSMIFVASL